jgi:hypothetical protein
MVKIGCSSAMLVLDGPGVQRSVFKLVLRARHQLDPDVPQHHRLSHP